MRMLPSILILTASALCYGCDVGGTLPSSEKPDVKAWENKGADTIAAESGKVDTQWWRSLKDPVLDRLLREAAGSNLDLKIAGLRMKEAQAQAGRASAALFPEVGVTGALTGEGRQSSRGGPDAASTRSELGISGIWDLDLFGGKRAELEASEANLGNAEASRRQAVQTLIADVARTYVEVRAQQQLLELTQKNLRLQQETLRATRIQFEAKAAAKLDVLRAQAQVSSTQAELPAIRASLAARQHRIAVLLGKPPQSIDAALKKPAAVPSFSDKIVLQTPIWTMASRPDIQAAEARLREQAALRSARAADIFPKLSLSAFFGLGTATLYSSATPWNLGANLAAPLLNFGRIESDIEAADARAQQALQRYRKTVLEALEEVENALVQYGEQKRRVASLEQSSASQREAARLARLKYDAGDAAFIDVLIAEERLLQAESGVVQARAAATRAAIDLYTAMGVVAPVETLTSKGD